MSWIPPNTELHNRQNLFVPGAQSNVFPSAPAGLLYPGDPGVPAGLIPTEKTAFAPRIGVAWDPTGQAKWLISSGYGIFYEPYYTGQGGPLQDPISAPPYLADAASELSELLRSLQWREPVCSIVHYAAHLAGGIAEASSALRARLEPECSAILRRKLAIRGRLCRDGRQESCRRFIEGNPAVYVPGAVDGK